MKTKAKVLYTSQDWKINYKTYFVHKLKIGGTHYFNKGTMELGAVITSGLFSQCCIMGNAYLTWNTEHYFDVIAENVKSPKIRFIKKREKERK